MGDVLKTGRQQTCCHLFFKTTAGCPLRALVDEREATIPQSCEENLTHQLALSI